MKCQKVLKKILPRNKSLVVGHITFTQISLSYLFFQVEYLGLSPGSEREIFQRVQLGMTLTAAGKLFS